MSKSRVKPTKQNVANLLVILDKIYPDAHCSLNFRTPFELLAATIMSAQATDVRVNIVTEQLFKRYRTVEEYAAASPEEVAEVIRTVGCFRNKARSVVGSAQIICARYGGVVPATMEDLVTLPGVGRKTANVVLSNAFNVAGFAVDTHVKRVAFRLGLTTLVDPEKIEKELCALIPPLQWGHTSHLLIYHGRAVCKARKPDCECCPVEKQCAKCF
jgi:endonuclease-3